MKQYRIAIGKRSFDVQVLDDPRQEQVTVMVNGKTLVVHVEDPAAAARASSPAPAAAPAATVSTADDAAIAPLPGVVKSIAVRPGQHVAPGDELMVIEAMKMDNVIRAQREGTIATVLVNRGQQVEYGDRLVEYEGQT